MIIAFNQIAGSIGGSLFFTHGYENGFKCKCYMCKFYICEMHCYFCQNHYFHTLKWVHSMVLHVFGLVFFWHFYKFLKIYEVFFSYFFVFHFFCLGQYSHRLLLVPSNQHYNDWSLIVSRKGGGLPLELHTTKHLSCFIINMWILNGLDHDLEANESIEIWTYKLRFFGFFFLQIFQKFMKI